jgi:1-acyl-sn-glycerol-3-phosphate acyltransferase
MREAQPSSGFGRPLRELARSAAPLALRDLRSELEDRLRKIPTRLNEYGFDRWGMRPQSLVDPLLFSAILYRYYFRVETHGAAQVPAGRVLLIGNHAGQLPFDAMMVGAAALLEFEPPRIARGMGEYWIPQLPFVSSQAARSGQMVGTPENCIQLLEAGECVSAFPEGVRGMNKLFRDRRRLMRFGLGFMRLALQTDTPIVPVAVVGSDEQQPGLANLRGLGRLLGMPAFPITPTFPWLGPLGLLPLPVHYHVYFGEPLEFEGSPHDEDAVVEAKVEQVRAAIQGMLERGRAERPGIFV